MPLFATNGRVQDLPANTQFKFWDNQSDWGRAYKIAKIELGYAKGFKHIATYETYIHLLLDVISKDPCRTFISRPAYQAKDWAQWGAFCSWFFYKDIIGMDNVLSAIRWGDCGRWLGQFLASGRRAYASNCYWSDEKVDNTIFWDMHDFDQNNCRSIRQVPPEFPTPAELEAMVRLGEYLGSETPKQPFEKPNMNRLVSQTTLDAPPEIEMDSEDEKFVVKYAKPIAVGAVVFAAVSVFVYLVMRD